MYVFENRLCFNCLKTGHSSVACRAKNRCDQCHRKHHTLLHPSTTERKKQTPKRTSVVSAAIQSGATAVQRPQVFLMTAMANIKTQQGHMQARCTGVLSLGSLDEKNSGAKSGTVAHCVEGIWFTGRDKNGSGEEVELLRSKW